MTPTKGKTPLIEIDVGTPPHAPSPESGGEGQRASKVQRRNSSQDLASRKRLHFHQPQEGAANVDEAAIAADAQRQSIEAGAMLLRPALEQFWEVTDVCLREFVEWTVRFDMSSPEPHSISDHMEFLSKNLFQLSSKWVVFEAGDDDEVRRHLLEDLAPCTRADGLRLPNGLWDKIKSALQSLREDIRIIDSTVKKFETVSAAVKTHVDRLVDGYDNDYQEERCKAHSQALDELNEEQRIAVVEGTRPGDSMRVTTILAGPGAGKTKALVTRMMQLMLHGGIKGRNMWLLAFNTNAKDEMLSRISQLVPLHQVNVQTIDAFCSRLVRKYGKILDLRPGEYRSECLEEGDAFKRLTFSRELHADFVSLKRYGLVDAEVKDWMKNGKLPEGREYSNVGLDDEQCRAMLSDYSSHLQGEDVAAFDEYLDKREKRSVWGHYDMMHLARILIHVANAYRAKEIEAADSFVSKMKYSLNAKHTESLNDLVKMLNNVVVLVDEFQDVDQSQFDLFQLVFRSFTHNTNFTIVGDVRQNIYRFRNSNSKYLEHLASSADNNPASYHVVKFHVNYRSSANIVALFNAISDYGQEYLLKDEEKSDSLFPMVPSPGRLGMTACREPPVVFAQTRLGEQMTYEFIVLGIKAVIGSCLNGRKVRPEDVVVLFRLKGESEEDKAHQSQRKKAAKGGGGGSGGGGENDGQNGAKKARQYYRHNKVNFVKYCETKQIQVSADGVKGGIIVKNFHAVKGEEFAVVFTVGLYGMHDLPEMAEESVNIPYVIASRAQSLLVMIRPTAITDYEISLEHKRVGTGSKGAEALLKLEEESPSYNALNKIVEKYGSDVAPSELHPPGDTFTDWKFNYVRPLLVHEDDENDEKYLEACHQFWYQDFAKHIPQAPDTPNCSADTSPGVVVACLKRVGNTAKIGLFCNGSGIRVKETPFTEREQALERLVKDYSKVGVISQCGHSEESVLFTIFANVFEGIKASPGATGDWADWPIDETDTAFSAMGIDARPSPQLIEPNFDLALSVSEIAKTAVLRCTRKAAYDLQKCRGLTTAPLIQEGNGVNVDTYLSAEGARSLADVGLDWEALCSTTIKNNGLNVLNMAKKGVKFSASNGFGAWLRKNLTHGVPLYIEQATFDFRGNSEVPSGAGLPVSVRVFKPDLLLCSYEADTEFIRIDVIDAKLSSNKREDHAVQVHLYARLIDAALQAEALKTDDAKKIYVSDQGFVWSGTTEPYTVRYDLKSNARRLDHFLKAYVESALPFVDNPDEAQPHTAKCSQCPYKGSCPGEFGSTTNGPRPLDDVMDIEESHLCGHLSAGSPLPSERSDFRNRFSLRMPNSEDVGAFLCILPHPENNVMLGYHLTCTVLEESMGAVAGSDGVSVTTVASKMVDSLHTILQKCVGKSFTLYTYSEREKDAFDEALMRGAPWEVSQKRNILLRMCRSPAALGKLDPRLPTQGAIAVETEILNQYNIADLTLEKAALRFASENVDKFSLDGLAYEKTLDCVSVKNELQRGAILLEKVVKGYRPTVHGWLRKPAPAMPINAKDMTPLYRPMSKAVISDPMRMMYVRDFSLLMEMEAKVKERVGVKSEEEGSQGRHIVIATQGGELPTCAVEVEARDETAKGSEFWLVNSNNDDDLTALVSMWDLTINNFSTAPLPVVALQGETLVVKRRALVNFKEGGRYFLYPIVGNYLRNISAEHLKGLRNQYEESAFRALTSERIDWQRLLPHSLYKTAEEYFLEIQRALGMSESKSQIDALKKAMEGSVSLVQGPPGTGKTSFIALSILSLMCAHIAAEKPLRILVSGFTNSSIENIIAKLDEVYTSKVGVSLHEKGPTCLSRLWLREHMTKFGAFKERAPVGTDMVQVIGWQPNSRRAKGSFSLGDSVKNDQHVVFATSYAVHSMNSSLLGKFDLIIDDEASQRPLHEFSMLLLALRIGGGVCLVGDHKQLEPVVPGSDKLKSAIRKSSLLSSHIALMDRRPTTWSFEDEDLWKVDGPVIDRNEPVPVHHGMLFQSAFEFFMKKVGNDPGVEYTVLQDCWRMNKVLCSAVQQAVYCDVEEYKAKQDGTINVMNPYVAEQLPLTIYGAPTTRRAMSLCSSTDPEHSLVVIIIAGVSPAWSASGDVLESRLFALLVDMFYQSMTDSTLPTAQRVRSFHQDGGIICMTATNKHRVILSEASNTRGVQCPVYTVDRAQGREAEIAMFSLGVTTPEQLSSEHHYDGRRINVGMSRGKKKNVLILHEGGLACMAPKTSDGGQLLDQFIASAGKYNAVAQIDASELLSL